MLINIWARFCSLAHDLSQEVSTRAAIIRSSTHAIKSVLRNPKFPLARKLTHVNTHLFLADFFSGQLGYHCPLPFMVRFIVLLFRCVVSPLKMFLTLL